MSKPSFVNRRRAIARLSNRIAEKRSRLAEIAAKPSTDARTAVLTAIRSEISELEAERAAHEQAERTPAFLETETLKSMAFDTRLTERQQRLCVRMLEAGGPCDARQLAIYRSLRRRLAGGGRD